MISLIPQPSWGIKLIIYFAITTRELNDTLIGALIGVMAGLSIRSDGEVEVKNKEEVV